MFATCAFSATSPYCLGEWRLIGVWREFTDVELAGGVELGGGALRIEVKALVWF